MQRTEKHFKLKNSKVFKQQLIEWAQQFETISWLDSNQYTQQHSSFDTVLAAEEFTSIKTDFSAAFEKLNEFQSLTRDYLFGYLSYDLKNDVETLESNNFDGLDFADLFFYQPQRIVFIKDNLVTFKYLKSNKDEIEQDFESIKNFKIAKKTSSKSSKTNQIKLRIQKDNNYKKVNTILQHINRGDI